MATGKILRDYKVFADPSELGLTGTPAMSAIADAMPRGSICVLRDNVVDQSALTQPTAGSVNVMMIVKATNETRVFAVGARSYVNSTLELTQLYFAGYTGTVWNGWKHLVTDDVTDGIQAAVTALEAGYKAGDTVTLNSGYINIFSGVAASTTIIRFLIPLSKPVTASSASISGKIRIRSEGLNTLVTIGTGNTATVVITPTGIGVQLTFDSAHGFTANVPCSVTGEGNDGTITFA